MYYKYLREILKERNSSSYLRKRKEFNVLRKKMSEIILKLDMISKETKEICEICEIIFRGAVKDAEATMNSMKMRLLEGNERVISLGATVLDIKKALSLNLEEKEQMKKEILSLSALVTDKEKLATKAESTLMEVQEQYDQVLQELNRLRDEMSHKERLISNNKMESNTMKKKLKEALEQLDLYWEEIEKLDQNLKLAMEKLSAADEERSILHATIEENQDVIAMVKTKEREHKKQMEYTIMSIEAISRSIADFEHEVAETVKRNNLRYFPINLYEILFPTFHL
ncbi:PREDICTED: girdin-like [Nelumbo nucifera]|uniref:Girdin-like n=1 Tax=Nelumbo nucifera TaxID=4432 RepID=A0A1U8Q002_NELNU|nr:PREDICTED: girdin-like [Nelumbo nucifera]